MKPHKHAEVIKSWADGETIEYRLCNTDKWESIRNPSFLEDAEYRRARPKEKKPVVRWLWARHNLQSWTLTDFYTEDELDRKSVV